MSGVSGQMVSQTSIMLSVNTTVEATYKDIPLSTVATPVFSLPAGTYTSAQNVAISTETPGAAIHYTTDGSEPTSASTLYSGAIPVASTVTVKAKAFMTGMQDSATAQAAYTINTPTAQETVATPVFSPAAGPYPLSQSVSISCTTPGAIIRYTTDDSEPTGTSALYSGAIPVTSNVTLKAKAFLTGMKDSATARTAYTIQYAPPSQGAPAIIAPLRPVTVGAAIGQTVTLTVRAENATGYQWHIDRGSGWQAIIDASGASYTTAPVTAENRGYRYYCEVRNDNGMADSPIFTLNVTEPAVIPLAGDSSAPGLWIGLMLLASAGLSVSAIRRRRRGES